MYNFDPVCIREYPKYIKSCAANSCFLKSWKIYAVQSFYPRNFNRSKESLYGNFWILLLNIDYNSIKTDLNLL